MQLPIFLARAINPAPMTSPLLALSQAPAPYGKKEAIATKFASSDIKEQVRDESEQREMKSRGTDMKAFLTVLVGVSSLIATAQLTLMSVEQLTPSSVKDASAGTIQTIYTPPNLGAPARTFGSATR